MDRRHFSRGFVYWTALGFTAVLGMTLPSAGKADNTNVPLPELIEIPAGPFLSGSDRAERELGYRLDEAAYGHSRTRERQWYEYEYEKKSRSTGAFRITRTLITNRQYKAFVDDTGHPWPDVEKATWQTYGLIHPYTRTRRHAWIDGLPPEGREDHPVVLVSQRDAARYAKWLSDKTGLSFRLPTWLEWEKAARGTDGRVFPWGDCVWSTLSVRNSVPPAEASPS